MGKELLVCGNCGDEVKICDNCERRFEEDDDIICFTGAEGDYHFCSEDCLEDFLDVSIVETTVECYEEGFS